MGLGDWLSKTFGGSKATPADQPKLSSVSEASLGASCDRLRPGERGWTALADAAALFSTQERQYAFGELDDDGRARLAEFAAKHRCIPDFRPTEERVYFRKSVR